MHQKNLQLLISMLCVLIVVSSCEYSLDGENFVEVQPPTSSHSFILNLDPGQDTIIVFNTTNFEFDINTFGLHIHIVEIIFADKTYEFFEAKNSFTVNPRDYPPGYYTLTLTCYTGSGTGSIADQVGAEGYAVQRQFILLIDGQDAPELDVKTSITEDGYLKLSWDKCENFNFHYYQVSGNNCVGSFTNYIFDANSTYFIDSCYYGDSPYYTVMAKVHYEYSNTPHYPIFVSEVKPELSIEEIGIDEIKISWTKSPYNVRYKLYIENSASDGLLLDSPTETEITIPQPGLGRNVGFQLKIGPNNNEGSKCSPCNSNSYSPSYISYYLGEDIGGSWPMIGYNEFDNIVYAQIYNRLNAYSLSPFENTNTFSIIDFDYKGNIACPTNSSRVAALSPEKIYVFESSNFSSPVEIGYFSWGHTVDHFSLSDNGIIAIAKNYKYDLIDVNTKELLASLDISPDRYPYYSKWAGISTSKLGEYVSFASHNGLDIFRYQDGAFASIYTDNRNYHSSLFHPGNNDQLLVTLSDGLLEIRDLPNFSLSATIQLPSSMVIQNIDPTTGYLLLTNYENLYVLDLSSGELVFSLKCDESKAWLYGSRLFAGFGFTLDISAYLKY